jgi:hypothetical protein
MEKIPFEKALEMTQYPESSGWYDFGKGVDVGADQINEWISEGLARIRMEYLKGDESPSTYAMSGNTLVAIFGFTDDDGSHNVNIFVSKSHKKMEIDNLETLVDVEFVEIDKG